MSEMRLANLSAAARAFDGVAVSYDELFTRTSIGRAQRKQVWQRLERVFSPGQRILELNCGTGEDARYLGRRGRSIVACDASAMMINVAAARTRQEAPGADISYLQLSNEELNRLPAGAQFDGAFSNFSGFNCLADLQPVARDLASLIKLGGNVLLCLWSRVCIGEFIWYLLHGQREKAVRRFSGKATARIGEITIHVAYPTVTDVRRALSPWFTLRRRTAIGLFVPPSYAEQWALRHQSLLRGMEHLDGLFRGWPVLRDIGDHVLLEFTRCNR